MHRTIKIALILLFLAPIVFQAVVAVTVGFYWLILLPFGLEPTSRAAAISDFVGAAIAVVAGLAGTVWTVRKVWPDKAAG